MRTAAANQPDPGPNQPPFSGPQTAAASSLAPLPPLAWPNESPSGQAAGPHLCMILYTGPLVIYKDQEEYPWQVEIKCMGQRNTRRKSMDSEEVIITEEDIG